VCGQAAHAVLDEIVVLAEDDLVGPGDVQLLAKETSAGWIGASLSLTSTANHGCAAPGLVQLDRRFWSVPHHFE
jgi:hypothetical protein